MAIFAGEDGRAAGGTERVGAEAVFKPNALAGDPVDVRGGVDRAAVATDRVRGVVVGHDEDDVWTFGGGLGFCGVAQSKD